MAIDVFNDMGDTLGTFPDRRDAERFESAIRLLRSLPARQNPKGEDDLAAHELLRGIPGVEEILLRVNVAIFGTEEFKLTDRVAPFVNFFFKNRSGELDDNFFYILAAFTSAELRELIKLYRTHFTEYYSSRENWIQPLPFHSGTPYLQILYILSRIKKRGLKDVTTFPASGLEAYSLEAKMGFFYLQIFEIPGIPLHDLYKSGLAAPGTEIRDSIIKAYQSTTVQIAHLNEALRILGPHIDETFNAKRLTGKVLDSARLAAMSLVFPGGRIYDTDPTMLKVLMVYVYAVMLANSGDAFDDIQDRGLGLEKSLQAIDRVVFSGERLSTADIYDLYIARDPETLRKFDVGESYFKWALPLLLDAWRFESRPSGDPVQVRYTLNICNAIAEIPEFLVELATSISPDERRFDLLEQLGLVQSVSEDSHAFEVTFKDGLDDHQQMQALIYTVVAAALAIVEHSDTMFFGSYARSHAFKNIPGALNKDGGQDTYAPWIVAEPLQPLLKAISTLKDRIPSELPVRKMGDRVEVIALERYNPLNLFVGHKLVSNCCMYLGSMGYSCSIDAFNRSEASSQRGLVAYSDHSSHIVVAYDPEAERFVGSNWAWGPRFSISYEVSNDTLQLCADRIFRTLDLAIYVLDQFELSAWADNLSSDQLLTAFMETVTSLYEPNEFNGILVNVGEDGDRVFSAYLNANNVGTGVVFGDVRYCKTEDEVYTDIEDTTTCRILKIDILKPTKSYGSMYYDHGGQPTCTRCDREIDAGDPAYLYDGYHLVCDYCAETCDICDRALLSEGSETFEDAYGDLKCGRCYTICEYCDNVKESSAYECEHCEDSDH